MKRATVSLAAALFLLAAPFAAAQVDTGLADLSMYVALGDSLTAGYASGGLAQFYQQGSYPALFAERAGITDFEQPLVSDPGIPPVLQLVSLQGPVIAPSSDTPGQPINATLPRPYNNLGVPGADLYDLLNTTGDITNLLAGNQDNVMHDLILRDGQHTALEQAIGLNPTFVTMWIGNNDVLGAAIYATPIDGVTMTPVDAFAAMYQQALGALAQYTSADIVVFTLPDVTAIPFVTTVEPFFTLPDGTHVPVIGSNGPLPEDAYVTLPAASLLAQGIGVPVELGGTGIPLPEDLSITAEGVQPGFVLRPEEVAVINQRIADFNQVIVDTAHAMGAKVLDINEIFRRVQQGFFIYGGFELTTDFLTGGLFSYDGVHPQHVGYALVASELIKLVNQEFRADIPQVNLYQILLEGPGAGAAAGLTAQEAARAYGMEALAQLRQAFPLLGPVPQRHPGVRRPMGRPGQVTVTPRLDGGDLR